MSTPAATSQDSGSMTVGQAAENYFEGLLEPEKAKPVLAEAETNAALQGDDDPDPDPEQEDEEEEKPEEADPEDEPVKKPELHTVTIDGKEEKVPLEELVKGYQRHSDYTRKTMDVAEQRKSVAAELQELRGEREHYKAVLGTLQKQAQESEPKIDWDRLAVENPNEWTRLQVQQFKRQAEIQNIEAERQRVAARQQEDADKGFQEMLAENSVKLLEFIPEWRDEKVASSEKAALVEYAISKRGYTREEVTNVSDPRAIRLLRGDWQHDQLLAKRANLKPDPAPVPKTAKPGPPATSQISQAQRAQQRLAKTGKVSDAAAVFERYI